MPSDIPFNPGRVSKLAAVSCVAMLLMNFGTRPMNAEILRLTEDEARKSVVQKVQPTYPPIARQINLSGRVVLDLIVGEDGTVEKTDVISGNPVLSSAAAAAGKRWKFQPFQADGKPAKTIVRVNFDFSK